MLLYLITGRMVLSIAGLEEGFLLQFHKSML